MMRPGTGPTTGDARVQVNSTGADVLLSSHAPDGVLTLTMNRPQVLNAFDEDLLLRLRAAVVQAGTDDSVRCVVLAGTGRGFCTGADLTWLASQYEQSAAAARLAGQLTADMFHTLEWCAKPIVAAVNGLAYAGGLALVLCTDLAVCSADAVFCVPEARHGLADPYMPARLPARIGQSKARAMMYGGQPISAADAQACGLVLQVCEPGDPVVDRAQRLAAEIAQSEPAALASYKAMMLQTQPPFAMQEYLDALVSNSAQAGVRRFIGRGRSDGGPPAVDR